MGATFILSVGCCLFSAIFLVILLATGMSKLEQTEWALKYSWWSESVDEIPITEPGLAWVGTGNSLLRFPNTRKNVYFSKRDASTVDDGDIAKGPLSVRTEDGLTIELEIEFTYVLEQSNLRKLYMLTGDNLWHSVLYHVSAGVIDNGATKFKSHEFYLNRTFIQMAFLDDLTRILSKRLWIQVRTLQLLPAHFPEEYSAAIKKTQMWKTDIDVAIQENMTKMIQKQTALKTATVLAEQVKEKALGEAAKIRLDNNATVEQFRYRQKKEAEGYQQAFKFFVDADPTNAVAEFRKYMKTRAFKGHDDGHKTMRMSGIPASR